MSCKNMPLWYKNYFELKAVENQQIQLEFSSSPWTLPDPGVKLVTPALAGEFFTTEPPGKLI